MDNNEFPANSKYNRKEETPEEEAPKPEKVITGSVVRRKKSFGRRVAEHIFGGADGESIVSYVGGEILLPAFRDMISDAVIGATERSLGLDRASGRRPGGYRPNRGGPIPYDRYSGPSSRHEPRREISSRARETLDFADVLLETRAEAQEVLERLRHYTDKYGQASAAHLDGLLGITPPYTHEKYGWYRGDLDEAGIHRARGGRWFLDVPPPVVLE